jgi:uncharacterized tellurite resistance protein B-like protein
MDNQRFQKLLLRSTVAVMACDGEIHQSEMNEIRDIVLQAPFFKNINAEQSLVEIINDINTDSRKFFQSFLHDTKSEDMTTMQKLLLFEVMLRMVNADQRIHENEIYFLKIAKSTLHIHDDLLIKRFGDIPLLTQNQENFIQQQEKRHFLAALEKLDLIDAMPYVKQNDTGQSK